MAIEARGRVDDPRRGTDAGSAATHRRRLHRAGPARDGVHVRGSRFVHADAAPAPTPASTPSRRRGTVPSRSPRDAGLDAPVTACPPGRARVPHAGHRVRDPRGRSGGRRRHPPPAPRRASSGAVRPPAHRADARSGATLVSHRVNRRLGRRLPSMVDAPQAHTRGVRMRSPSASGVALAEPIVTVPAPPDATSASTRSDSTRPDRRGPRRPMARRRPRRVEVTHARHARACSWSARPNRRHRSGRSSRTGCARRHHARVRHPCGDGGPAGRPAPAPSARPTRAS